jgi:hypothetical protein
MKDFEVGLDWIASLRTDCICRARSDVEAAAAARQTET